MRRLFADGPVDAGLAKGTITQSVLKSSQDVRMLEYEREGRYGVSQVGWPEFDAEMQAILRATARQLPDVFFAYLDAASPLPEESELTHGFNVEHSIPMHLRETLVKGIASRLGIDADTAWTDIGGQTYPVSGLLARAEFFATPAGCQLVSMSSHVHDPQAVNLAAWLATLRDLSGRETAARQSAVCTMEKCLILATQTSSIEHFLCVIALIELTSRAHKLNVVQLGGAITFLFQDLSDRRAPGDLLEPTALLVATGSPPGIVKASKYLLRMQNVYRDITVSGP
jgi:hypothetical protein